MSRFFKFLILLAVVINLTLVFVFDGKIPSNLQLPFVKNTVESVEPTSESMKTQPEAVEKEETTEPEILPEETDIEEPEEEEPEEEEIVPSCRIIDAGGSNIRSGPGTGFEIITAYPYDTVLTLTGEPEIGWYPILAEDGTEGYIFENQIEILDKNAVEEDALQTEGLLQ